MRDVGFEADHQLVSLLWRSQPFLGTKTRNEGTELLRFEAVVISSVELTVFLLLFLASKCKQTTLPYIPFCLWTFLCADVFCAWGQFCAVGACLLCILAGFCSVWAGLCFIFVAMKCTTS